MNHVYDQTEMKISFVTTFSFLAKINRVPEEIIYSIISFLAETNSKRLIILSNILEIPIKL